VVRYDQKKGGVVGFQEFDKPEGVSINEVGMVILGEHHGLLIVSDDPHTEPASITLIPEEIQDEYTFTLTVNPNVAHFLGALQRDKRGLEVDDHSVMAGRLMWWLVIENARHQLEGVKDDTEEGDIRSS
jgi:hypothetical protein